METKKDYLVPELNVVIMGKDVMLASAYGTDDVAGWKWGDQLEGGFGE